MSTTASQGGGEGEEAGEREPSVFDWVPLVNMLYDYAVKGAAAPELKQVMSLLGLLTVLDGFLLLLAYSFAFSVSHDELVEANARWDRGAERAIASGDNLTAQLAWHYGATSSLLAAALVSLLLVHAYLSNKAAFFKDNEHFALWWSSGRLVVLVEVLLSLSSLVMTYATHTILFKIKFPDMLDAGLFVNHPMQGPLLVQLGCFVVPVGLVLALFTRNAHSTAASVFQAAQEKSLELRSKQLLVAARDVTNFAAVSQHRALSEHASAQLDAANSYRSPRLMERTEVWMHSIQNAGFGLENSSGKGSTDNRQLHSLDTPSPRQVSTPRRLLSTPNGDAKSLLVEALSEARSQRSSPVPPLTISPGGESSDSARRKPPSVPRGRAAGHEEPKTPHELELQRAGEARTTPTPLVSAQTVLQHDLEATDSPEATDKCAANLLEPSRSALLPPEKNKGLSLPKAAATTRVDSRQSVRTSIEKTLGMDGSIEKAL